MRVAFFGSSPFSCYVLEGLLASTHVLGAVITQPDQPAGRRMQLTPTPVAELADASGLPVFKPQKLRGNAALRDALRGAGVEALAVASYGKIIPAGLLELTPWPLNVHPSPLPLLRGPSPLRTALLEGWARTEVCIMRMTPRIDDGPVAQRAPLTILPDWNYAELELQAGRLGAALLDQALAAVAAGQSIFIEQEHAEATLTRVHARQDSWIDWRRPASELADFVRAWDPDIGACTSFELGAGPRRLKIWRAAALPAAAADGEPGTVVQLNKRELGVQTGAGLLSLLEVQPESRPRMPAGSFMAGVALPSGAILGTTPLL